MNIFDTYTFIFRFTSISIQNKIIEIVLNVISKRYIFGKMEYNGFC